MVSAEVGNVKTRHMAGRDTQERPTSSALSLYQMRHHRGMYVAKRGQHVVLTANSLEELLENDKLRPTDAVVFVPTSEVSFF
jgi:hypothetical protein